MKRPTWLSKSRITAFLQCPKRLWLETNRPELKEVSARTDALFMVGHQVGDVARAEYPGGTLVGHDKELSAALDETAVLMKARDRRPVFEATFAHEGVLVRADLMLPRKNGWHMAEVKSSGSPTHYQLDDLAIQTWVVRESGVPVSRATVRHIDTSFVYRGNGNYKGLLVDGAVGSELRERIPQVPSWADGARKTLAGEEPAREMGTHCEDPFTCPFTAHCTSKAPRPPKYPVDLLPGGAGRKAAEALRSEGFADLTKVPLGKLENERLHRIHLATAKGEVFRDSRAAAEAIKAWRFPRAYLDFETISFAVPIWAGTRPYQQIPFQWSCHIMRREGRLEHRQFLDLSGENPARACAEQLVRDLDGCETIVAYNASFERGVIDRLALSCPDLKKPLGRLSGRIRDLLVIVRENYYHRDMLGSFSIKAVLPTLASGIAYDKLGEVQDGMAAQAAYLEAIHPATNPQRKEKIADALRRYCELDSKAMIAVSDVLVN